MCIIIDACCADGLGNPALPQGDLIRKWVRAGGRVVTGGRLEAETKNTSLQSLLVQWSAAGRLVRIEKGLIDEQEAQLDLAMLRSNDPHVIALAKASGAQVVVTRDRDLMADLKQAAHCQPARKIYPFPQEPATHLRAQRGVLRAAACR